LNQCACERLGIEPGKRCRRCGKTALPPRQKLIGPGGAPLSNANHAAPGADLSDEERERGA